MPNMAGINRRRRPSATEYCRDRYVTTACATVNRTVLPERLLLITMLSARRWTGEGVTGCYQGRPCNTTVFSSVISATAVRGPSLPMPLPFNPP
jgi:hypothetical protein